MDEFDKAYKDIKGFGAVSGKINNATEKTIHYMRSHWVDYMILFLICFVLGAFDVFVIQKSDKVFEPQYWYHAACRITAYVLASVLGIRIMYPRAKSAHKALQEQLTINEELKKRRGADFSEFIVRLNIKLKAEAWKSKINRKIQRLESAAKLADIRLFNSNDEDGKAKSKFCRRKKELEYLKSDEYISEHIQYLKIKYYRIYEHDFDYNSRTGEVDYLHYKTRTSIYKSTSYSLCQVVLTALLVACLIGSITIGFDEALATSRVVRVFTIVINSLVDIGLTLWKLISGMSQGEKLVETEDLRVVLDQNKILSEYVSEQRVPSAVVAKENNSESGSKD